MKPSLREGAPEVHKMFQLASRGQIALHFKESKDTKTRVIPSAINLNCGFNFDLSVICISAIFLPCSNLDALPCSNCSTLLSTGLLA